MELWHQELVVGLHWAFSNVMTSHLQVRAGRAHYNPPTTALRFAPRSQTRTPPIATLTGWPCASQIATTPSVRLIRRIPTPSPRGGAFWSEDTVYLIFPEDLLLEQALRSSNHFP